MEAIFAMLIPVSFVLAFQLIWALIPKGKRPTPTSKWDSSLECWQERPDPKPLSDEERRHQETLQAIGNGRGGLFGFGYVATVVIVLWLLGYHFH